MSPDQPSHGFWMCPHSDNQHPLITWVQNFPVLQCSKIQLTKISDEVLHWSNVGPTSGTFLISHASAHVGPIPPGEKRSLLPLGEFRCEAENAWAYLCGRRGQGQGTNKKLRISPFAESQVAAGRRDIWHNESHVTCFCCNWYPRLRR